MAKLSANQERSRAKADSSNVPKQSKKIASTFPDRTTAPAIEQFIKSATIAVERYLALLPSGKPRSRRHRKAAQSGSTAPPNRPSDAQRRALVGDIYDAYLTARNEDEPSYSPYPIEPPSPLASIGRGMVDVTDPVDKWANYLLTKLGALTPQQYAQREAQRSDSVRLYNQGVGKVGPAGDLWRSSGNMAMLVPLTGSAMAGSALSGLAQGYADAASRSNDPSISDAANDWWQRRLAQWHALANRQSTTGLMGLLGLAPQQPTQTVSGLMAPPQ